MIAAPGRRARLATLVALATLATAACASEGTRAADGPSTTTARPARTIRVPDDEATIQAGIDAARPGDLVLVAAGTYHESVTIETPRVVLRGIDRNEVVIDGDLERENGIKVFSDGVAVENLTVRRHTGNGVLFTGDYQSGNPLDGFRVSYVTAADDGLYGIYAFGATHGLIEHTYTSGHPSSGIYVGQCYPCATVVRDSVAEWNASGFQGANAGGDLVVATSTFRHNRIGIESVSSTKEALAPQRDATIVANRVEDNDGDGAPRAIDTFGVGIAIGGGRVNQVRRNVVTGNVTAGIVVSEQESFLPEGNRVLGNTVQGNGVDLVYAVASGEILGNCFADNTYATSSPPTISAALACVPEAQGGAGAVTLGRPPPDVDWRAVALPAPQPSMPDAATTPARAAGRPPTLDLDALEVPAGA